MSRIERLLNLLEIEGIDTLSMLCVYVCVCFNRSFACLFDFLIYTEQTKLNHSNYTQFDSIFEQRHCA